MQSCLVSVGKTLHTVTRFYKVDLSGMVVLGLRAQKAALELTVRKSQGAKARRNEKEMKPPF